MKTTTEILSENVEKVLKRDNRVLLRGLPGVGKTHFCFKFCENSNRNYIIVDCEYDYYFLEKMLNLPDDHSFNEEFRKLCEINSDNFTDTILVFENIEYSELFCRKIYPMLTEKDFTLIMTCRTLNPVISYIAAYTAQFEIHPESFLDAFSKVARLKNYTDMIKGHTETLKHIPELLHREFSRECEYYMHYGGLPLAVSTYLDSDKNLEELKTIHDSNRYYVLEKLLDISDLSDIDKLRCRQVIDSVFEQMLYTDYNRYTFSYIRRGCTQKDYMHIINFLVDNGILIKVQNTELDEAFILYYYDCGVLYHRLLQLSNRQTTSEFNQNIQKIIKRNFVVTELISRGITPFYRKAKNKAFIDFIFTNPQKNNKFACRICNGIDRHDKKLEAFRIENPDTWLVTLSDGNFEMKGKKITIPFYAISCIPDLII